MKMVIESNETIAEKSREIEKKTKLLKWYLPRTAMVGNLFTIKLLVRTN
jgi:hypothetical protein